MRKCRRKGCEFRRRLVQTWGCTTGDGEEEEEEEEEGRDEGKWGGEGKENKSVRTYWGSTMQSMAPLIHMSLSHPLVLLPFPVPHVQGMLEHVALREQVSINFD